MSNYFGRGQKRVLWKGWTNLKGSAQNTLLHDSRFSWFTDGLEGLSKPAFSSCLRSKLKADSLKSVEHNETPQDVPLVSSLKWYPSDRWGVNGSLGTGSLCQTSLSTIGYSAQKVFVPPTSCCWRATPPFHPSLPHRPVGGVHLLSPVPFQPSYGSCSRSTWLSSADQPQVLRFLEGISSLP